MASTTDTFCRCRAGPMFPVLSLSWARTRRSAACRQPEILWPAFSLHKHESTQGQPSYPFNQQRICAPGPSICGQSSSFADVCCARRECKCKAIDAMDTEGGRDTRWIETGGVVGMSVSTSACNVWMKGPPQSASATALHGRYTKLHQQRK